MIHGDEGLLFVTRLICDRELLYERTYETQADAQREADSALADARRTGWIQVPSDLL